MALITLRFTFILNIQSPDLLLTAAQKSRSEDLMLREIDEHSGIRCGSLLSLTDGGYTSACVRGGCGGTLARHHFYTCLIMFCILRYLAC